MAAYPYRFKETVEICKKQEGFQGRYYPGSFLAAVGRNRCLVQYETRFTEDKKRLLTEVVNPEDIRPLPPMVPYSNFSSSDKVDAYISEGWCSGKIIRKVDPNYHVKLDSTGNEVHIPFYKVRFHLDWKDGRWVLPEKGSGNEDNEANPEGQGH